MVTGTLPGIIPSVVFEKQAIEGVYRINNITLFTHNYPIINDRMEVPGMPFAD